MNDPWHISSHVGGTGQEQIFSFYRLIEKIKSEGLCPICHGRETTKELFAALNGGKIFPGHVFDQYRGEKYWWDDFTDISGANYQASNYSNLYGKWFTDAQDIVKWKIEEQSGKTD